MEYHFTGSWIYCRAYADRNDDTDLFFQDK